MSATYNKGLGSPLVQIENALPAAGRAARGRLPEWLRKADVHHESVTALKRDLRRLDLHTVCESATAPTFTSASIAAKPPS